MSRRIWVPLVLAALMVPIALAQDNTGGNREGNRDGDRGGDRGGERRGGFDPAAMRQGMMDRIKEQMGVTNEDEWKVIQGKLDPVMTKRMEAAGGMGGGFRFGRGGGGGGAGGRGGDDNNDRPRSAVEQASRDLRTTLENKDATEDQVKEKLTAFREARDKARSELTAAQKELKEILAPGRQEAVLVQYGFLE
jgi:hypothetical protein